MLFLFVMHTSNWTELVCASLNWPQPAKVDADVMHQALLLDLHIDPHVDLYRAI